MPSEGNCVTVDFYSSASASSHSSESCVLPATLSKDPCPTMIKDKKSTSSEKGILMFPGAAAEILLFSVASQKESKPTKLVRI